MKLYKCNICKSIFTEEEMRTIKTGASETNDVKTIVDNLTPADDIVQVCPFCRENDYEEITPPDKKEEV